MLATAASPPIYVEPPLTHCCDRPYQSTTDESHALPVPNGSPGLNKKEARHAAGLRAKDNAPSPESPTAEKR
jgi:hypothetical protein